MILIGLTGTIASGKSTVAEYLRKAGVPVIDADEQAKLATAPNAPALNQIREYFGPDVFHSDGSLNRGSLAKIIFNDEQARRRLEEVVHPAIQKLVDKAIQKLRDEKASTVVYVAPLIFEKNLQHRFDHTILVYAPKDTLIKRMMKRDQLSMEDAKLRIDAQMDTQEKIKLANHLIENDGGLEELFKKLAVVWKKITGENLAI